MKNPIIGNISLEGSSYAVVVTHFFVPEAYDPVENDVNYCHINAAIKVNKRLFDVYGGCFDRFTGTFEPLAFDRVRIAVSALSDYLQVSNRAELFEEIERTITPLLKQYVVANKGIFC